MTSDTSIRPEPDSGWSREVVHVPEALVMPPTASAMVQDCGVAGPEGWVGHAATWRGHRPMMTPPAAFPEPTATLPGRHLWCGQLWSHFGHFLCESMARIWGMAEAGAVDSLVFVPKRPGRVEATRKWQNQFLRHLGIDLPITIVTEPTRIGHLVVPGQGFGLGPIDRGTPEFRAFFHARFCRDVAPEGPERLYLSRSALGGLQGGVVMEERLEANLAAAGYEIFHPENHPIATQIARYRAATHILGLDGSAFHMVGFVARPEQRCAVILRRNSSVPMGLVHQIEAFSGRAPDLITEVVADWIPVNRDRPGRYSFGELDSPAVAARLGELGYIDNAADWRHPRFRRMKRAINDFAARKNLEFERRAKPDRRRTRAASEA